LSLICFFFGDSSFSPLGQTTINANRQSFSHPDQITFFLRSQDLLSFSVSFQQHRELV
jgi:hypothetical protein